MGRAAFAYKLLQFWTGEFGLIATGFAVTFAIYVALYLFWFRTPGRRSLAGLARYLFPAEVFRHARIDFFVYLVGKLVCAPLVMKVLALIAIETTMPRLLNVLFGNHALAATNSALMLLTQFLVFYVASNFAFYWAHRAMHQNRFLWSVHRAHHSAEALTFFAAARANPLETMGTSLWTTLWGASAVAALHYCTGVAMHPLFPLVMSFWFVFTDVIDKFQHSHVRTSLGMLDYIIPSGGMHEIHHSAELKHRDKNFGNTLAVFDWMFGTIYIPAPGESILLGLNEQELGTQNPHQRIIDIYAEPFAHAWRTFRNSRMASMRPPAASTASETA
jgi:sterol desaturase/sphingolipid hydroxylase (fatty acid hydroxylase superfamily)